MAQETERIAAPVTARGRATRQSLLDAAEQVFGDRSYDGASIAEITRTAGVAQGTFYQYFPDKKAAFVELVHGLNHSLRETISRAVADTTSRIEAERVGFRTFFDYVTRHKALYRIIRECEFVDIDTYRWHYQTLAAGYSRGLDEAQRRGEITMSIPAEDLAWILMGIAESAGSRWVLMEDRQPSEDALETLMTFIGCALAPGEAA
ncbi:MAG: TetR/AcrR family transcriptional regulator [Acidimicrobiia bacterium]|nr:TetR/AcrR family transcriptional regulator [Acidimicrobiia bacterium]NNC73949.1 TetR/AcrR family transcriptional regulator [Acidimicrobiia bacterium]